MSFSPEWNEIYARGEQIVTWPWSDLISLVMRNGCTQGIVLELGCGKEFPNARFFSELGMDYYGVDAAFSGLPCVDYRYGGKGAHLQNADFTDGEGFGGPYDLICDRAAVTHNDTASIKRTLKSSYGSLKPGGYYIGVDYFSDKHGEYWYKSRQIDEFTKTDFEAGQFKGVGKVHFSDKAHLEELFKDFEILQLSEKVITTEGQPTFASWNIVARKT